MRSKQVFKERTSYAWYVTENKDKVQNNLNLGNEIFNQGRSKAKKSGGSNVLNFSKFGPKLKKKFFLSSFTYFFQKLSGLPKELPKLLWMLRIVTTNVFFVIIKFSILPTWVEKDMFYFHLHVGTFSKF